MDGAFFHQRAWLAIALFTVAACSNNDGASSGAGGTSTDAGGALMSGGAGSAIGGAGGNPSLPSTGGSGGTLAMGGSNASLGGASNGGVGASGGAPIGGASAAGGNGGAVSGGAGGSSAAGSAGLGGSSGGAGGGNAYLPCPMTAGAACSVLPLGDSITEGYGSSGAGYRVELFTLAVQNSKNLTFVGSLQNGPSTVANRAFPQHHEGHDGYTIDSGTGHSGISGSITDQAIANYHPNIVLLMIGTNDINGNIDIATAPNRLGNLIDDITTRAPNALVVVATIIPIANAGTNQNVKTYDATIPGLVSARASAGKHVVLVDNYAAFSQDPNYQTSLMYNYLHPNDAGYAVLGRAFYGAIGALLPPSG
jgi:lysophospholipase L1-like esterase